MNVKAYALATGILFGFLILVLTVIDTALGRGGHLSLLQGLYPGFTVSYAGGLIGLVYGFVSGVILGAIFCWLYNLLARAPAGHKS